jgi:hypothetical protein
VGEVGKVGGLLGWVGSGLAGWRGGGSADFSIEWSC